MRNKKETPRDIDARIQREDYIRLFTQRAALGPYIDECLEAAGTYRLKASEYRDAASLAEKGRNAAYIAAEIIENRKQGRY